MSIHPEQQAALRAIPPVNVILETPPIPGLLAIHARELVTAAVQEALATFRTRVLAGQVPDGPVTVNGLAAALAADAAHRVGALLAPRLTRVINATGVVLHTNLGRAPLAASALAHITATAEGYSNVELDLATGERGSRYSLITDLLCRLTGAEAAMVVNNNAAAVLLMLSALCAGREVVVSRGELVEIGGSFRVPDVMQQGGARLVEVGSTNKTHRRDYEGALRAETGAILKVHTSNYKLIGFTAAVDTAEMAEVAHAAGLPLLVDWGSGVLTDLPALNPDLPPEATMRDLIAAGADIVTFSGDKLLGGPQGGFVVGKKALLDRMKRHPLTRAVRVDKLTLAGIEATLRLYLDPQRAVREIPTLRMLARGPAELRVAAGALAADMAEAVGDQATITVIPGTSQAGGGSLPGVELSTYLVAVAPTLMGAHVLEERLRAGTPPVLARVAEGKLLLDPRTLLPGETVLLVGTLNAALVGEVQARG